MLQQQQSTTTCLTFFAKVRYVQVVLDVLIVLVVLVVVVVVVVLDVGLHYHTTHTCLALLQGMKPGIVVDMLKQEIIGDSELDVRLVPKVKSMLVVECFFADVSFALRDF